MRAHGHDAMATSLWHMHANGRRPSTIAMAATAEAQPLSLSGCTAAAQPACGLVRAAATKTDPRWTTDDERLMIMIMYVHMYEF